MARPPGHGIGFEPRREEIIDLAAQLFARKGYAATGVSDLAKATNLGKGALYHYIGSKEQLLVEIQDRVLAPLLEASGRVLRYPAAASVRLRMLSEVLLKIIVTKLDHIWVYEHDYRYLTGENLSRMLGQRRQFEAIVRELVAEAITAGEIVPRDLRSASRQFLNLHNYTYQWVHHDDPPDPSELASEFSRTFLRGFEYRGDLAEVERQARTGLEQLGL